MMCHSVEMYLPRMTRSAAERRIGAADFAAAERERRVVDLELAVLGRIRRLAGFLIPRNALLKLEQVPNPLKINRAGFEHASWLMKGEAHGLRRPAAAVGGTLPEGAAGRLVAEAARG